VNIFTQDLGGQTALRAMPLLLVILCVLAIAYRYYSAFLAAKVAAFDDSRTTPAHQFNDGQNYHPTNRWVLFGHHFAAISGAGPLIGPVLAIQYGYMPGLLWLVIGVCLAGAVQDMMVLASSVRRGGKSLAQIALTELGRPAAIVTCLAILAIVVIALAGLGIVVVKALGGEDVKLAANTQIKLASADSRPTILRTSAKATVYRFPAGCQLQYPGLNSFVVRPETFDLRIPNPPDARLGANELAFDDRGVLSLPQGTVQEIPGSSWGTFTIACTIPIALLVSLWMYVIRKGHITEASILGAIGVLFATVAGSWIPGSVLEPYFSLSKDQTIFALCAYGFIASVLPVWLLLCPRDYISSFLKVGTIALLILGVIVANPVLRCPPINETFKAGGPTFEYGGIFPFVFICVMCGAVSGFHALVSSGTTPKMIDKESDIRMIGYGSMLMEGVVGVVALLAAASLPVDLYYDINVDAGQIATYQKQLDQLYSDMHIDRNAARDRLHAVGVGNVTHLDVENADLGQLEQLVGNESLRGRTGGAVTLAVGMSRILTTAMHTLNLEFEGVVKYWYHFAIMFEALFILTTIDTGTRIARFLLQETLGKVIPAFERPDWLPGSILATAAVTAGWGGLIFTGSIGTIWPMFGIANQLLAAMALALVTTLLINSGRGRYAWVTIVPMAFVITTTMTAGVKMSYTFIGWIQAGEDQVVKGTLSLSLTVFVMATVGTVLLIAISRWVAVATGMIGAPKS
jgi:carbon starvation protein